MIDVSKPRYDQNTYWGRLKHFSELTDPTNLLVTSEQLERAKRMIDLYKANKLEHVDEEILWKAKKLVDSTFHPDTGEKIFLPFRMASFVPTNVPIIAAAMLVPNPSTAMIIGLQWLNQSVNVAFNFANANKTSPMSFEESAIAYTAAVTSSCSIALGLNHYVNKKLSASMLPILSRIVPFVAVSAAGTLNVYLMRRKELIDGIQVFDKDGQVLGKSKLAGATAIKQVALSRIVTAAPALFIPGMLMTAFERTKLVKTYPQIKLPLNLLSVSVSLMAALPCAIALEPQISSIRVEDAELEFQGKGVSNLYFNRGL